MTRGVDGHSPANVTTHLKVVHFPAKKQDLIKLAKQNGAAREVLEEIERMPDQEYASVAEIMKAYGKSH